MKIRDKTPSAILNFLPPPLLESRVLRIISKLRRGMGGLKSPSSLRWRSALHRLFVHSHWFSTPVDLFGWFCWVPWLGF